MADGPALSAIDLVLTQAPCIQVGGSPGEICIFFPGGATICAGANYEFGDPYEITLALLAQVNTALAPLQPFFNILDVLKALVDCVKAIPDALGPPPNPQPIIDCVKNLAEALEKLVELFPPLSILRLVKSVLVAIATASIGLRDKLAALAEQEQRILAAATAAATLGNLELQTIADCAAQNLDIQLQNLNAQMAPLNRLIGLVNALLELAGLPCIPTLADLTSFVTAPLDAAIEVLETAANAIPVSLDLGAIPPPDAPC